MKRPVSTETIRALEEMLEQARAGALVGLAFIALEGHAYTADAVGLARERPTLTRGMIPELDEVMRDLTRR